MNRNRAHTALVKAIRLRLGAEDDVVMWLNTVSTVKTEWGWEAFGLSPGSSDLVGILAPSGRWVALEVKTGTGRAEKDQKLFIDLVRRLGGFAAVVRSELDAVEAIARARAGASE